MGLGKLTITGIFCKQKLKMSDRICACSATTSVHLLIYSLVQTAAGL